MKNKIMAQMMAKQKRFIVENQTFYEACGPGEFLILNEHDVEPFSVSRRHFFAGFHNFCLGQLRLAK